MKDTDLALPPWRDTYRRLLTCCGAQAAALRSSFFCLLVAAAVQGMALACLFPLLRALFQGGEGSEILFWLCLMTLLSLVAVACRWYGQGFEYRGRMALATHELRMRLGTQLRQIPLARLQERHSGEINALLLGSVDEQLNYTLAIANLLMSAVVTPLTAAGAVMLADWRLGVMLLLIFPLIVPLYRWRRPAMARAMGALTDAHRRLSADIVEYVQGLAALRAACRADEQVASLAAGFRALRGIQTQSHRNSVGPDALVASLVELGMLAVVAAGVCRAVVGTLDVAAIAAVMVIVVRFAEPLANCVSYTVVLELVERALQRIENLLAVAPLPVGEPAATPASGEIIFNDVSFRYPSATAWALQQIAVTIPARGMVAFVGPSGSGKTTLARLLLRYADPQHGNITLGGADLRRMTEAVRNQLVSVVFQDVYLFDDTLLENIRMARPEATMEEIETAAREAQCLDFIQRLPQGWQTPLGEKGARLSGGERQRVSIARALLKNAPIVILDEPTAALDTESELAVQRAIERLVRRRTVIVIAHRLSTIVGADRIFVLERGRIMQQGRHQELLACAGRYRAMWQAQRRLKNWRPDRNAMTQDEN